jgi:hypothetical protein
VEFATKVAALDCIAKLDNESADGKKKWQEMWDWYLMPPFYL